MGHLWCTSYKHDFNVGLGKYILGEYVLDHNDVQGIVSSDPSWRPDFDKLNENHKKELVEKYKKWIGDFNQDIIAEKSLPRLYWGAHFSDFFIREYNQSIFRRPVELRFNKENFLTLIEGYVRDEYKDEMIVGLIEKYGPNRSSLYVAKNLYRAEVWNRYGTIFVDFLDETYAKSYILQMSFVKLDQTKSFFDKIEKEEKERKLKEIEQKALKESKSRDIKDLFDI